MTDVSRGTPPAPEAAATLFPGSLATALRFADLLATDGVVRGLIGPREVPRLWDRHLLNCALLAGAIGRGARVCDVGSGAGLPGLVLAVARPDLEVTLVEPLLRRTAFLSEVVATLGLAERVHVERARAESLHGTALFDVVTSRAVARLPRLVEWCMPLVAPDGVLLAMKGRSLPEEIREARSVLTRLGCAEPETVELGNPESALHTTAVRIGWRPAGR